MSANYRNPQWLLPNCKNLKLPGTGTSVGSGLTEDRHSLYSMEFSSGNYISANNTFLNSSTEFSISFWAKLSVASLNIVLGDIITPYSHGFSFNWAGGYEYVSGTVGTIIVRCQNGSSSPIILFPFAGDTNWHHFAVTYKTGTRKLYVNGSLSATNASGPSSMPATLGNTFKIGIDNSGGSNVTNGKIDEVAIFNTELKANEVQALSTANAPANIMALDKKPIAYYPLGEQARVGGDANPNAGGSEWQFPNQVLQSHVFDFDGSTDYIDAGSSLGVIGTEVRTFSIWLKTSQTSVTQTVLGTRNYNTDGWVIQIYPNSILFYNVLGGATGHYSDDKGIYTTAANLTDGNWHHLVIVRAGAGNNKIYVDGVSQTLNTTYGDENLKDPQSSKNLLIGAGYNTGGALYRFFDGELSNVAIWNSDQSTNIANIYNNGAPQSSYTVTPTAWYKLNAATSSYDFSTSTWTITDSAGSNNGTSTTLPSTALVSSDLQFESPYSNFSLNFDGTGNKVDFGDSDVFSFGDGVTDSPLSFSVWINLATLGAPHCVINKQTSSSNGEYKIYISTAGKIYIELANNGGEANGARGIQSGTNLSIDQWYHLAFTYDGRGGSSAYDGMNLYINGSLDSSTDWSYLSYTAMNNTNADFILGDLITGGSNTYDFNGNLDEAAIFNKALTQAEVSQIYNNGYAADLTSLSPVSWWRLGEDAYFVNNFITVPNQISGAPNGTGAGTQTSILVADAPGSYASGAGTNLAVEDRKGDAPESTANSLSFNMIPTNRVSYPAGYTPTQIDNVYSMAFDGADDYFSAPISFLNSATVCSISFWGKKDASNKELVVGGRINGSDGIWIQWYTDGTIYFSPRGSGAGSFSLSYAQSYDADWHHYVGVYDGSSAANCKLYLDGNLVATGTGTPPSSLPATTGDVFQIGALGTTFYTTGSIDEVAIFNYALSERQIKQDIYDGTTTGKTADLNNISNLKAPVAWYRMGD